MLYEIRIYDNKGRIKKVISTSEASQEFWRKYWEEERNNTKFAMIIGKKRKKLAEARRELQRTVPQLMTNGTMDDE
ncbi:MAG: hypothetical protein COW88_01575 [Candidatus Lloydbacteria bacterium CG22_combo_CG10-13_8_21_14_all_47_15]|uniref:Phage protein n=1 Tax=Candidatus Lloydbacteria bacterium CG22_combo_CG10-13_8_21_14_all_47_15 TaxID=1974635 RepID=A0A2H0CVY3_9BACT|nr:MAG: hypothetical protein COW88_01575 [Candidatus Lloydbacteria bacterium CG22_combo_CG10-13_8_21_14_all_47_15]